MIIPGLLCLYQKDDKSRQMGAVKTRTSNRSKRVTVQNDAIKRKMQMQAVNPDTIQQTGGFLTAF